MQRNINSSLQSRRLNKYRQNTINNYCETHRNEKAYKNFKHMPDYGKKWGTNGRKNNKWYAT